MDPCGHKHTVLLAPDCGARGNRTRNIIAQITSILFLSHVAEEHWIQHADGLFSTNHEPCGTKWTGLRPLLNWVRYTSVASVEVSAAVSDHRAP